MTGATVQDRFSRGMGAAARALGMPHDVYRVRDGYEQWDGALAPELRVLRMWAAFDRGDPGYRRPRGYDRALRGIFDVDCTEVGDYLCGAEGVLFIALLPKLQRPLCVVTNAVVDVLRPGGPGLAGLNGYGGVQEPSLSRVLRGWPAALTNDSAGSGGALPDDGGMGGWTVLLPRTPVPVLGADLVQDGDGRRFVVRSAELTELGWRLSVRQVGV